MLMSVLTSIAIIVPAIALMLLPALIAAYGEKFVDIVCLVVWLFFRPITWPIEQIKNMLTKTDEAAK
jgi:hypothetical protein